MLAHHQSKGGPRPPPRPWKAGVGCPSPAPSPYPSRPLFIGEVFPIGSGWRPASQVVLVSVPSSSGNFLLRTSRLFSGSLSHSAFSPLFLGEFFLHGEFLYGRPGVPFSVPSSSGNFLTKAVVSNQWSVFSSPLLVTRHLSLATAFLVPSSSGPLLQPVQPQIAPVVQMDFSPLFIGATSATQISQ